MFKARRTESNPNELSSVPFKAAVRVSPAFTTCDDIIGENTMIRWRGSRVGFTAVQGLSKDSRERTSAMFTSAKCIKAGSIQVAFYKEAQNEVGMLMQSYSRGGDILNVVVNLRPSNGKCYIAFSFI